MRKILWGLLASLLVMGEVMASGIGDRLRVMTYNIRMDNPGDGDNQWKFRKDLAAEMVKFHEVLDRLPEFAYVGVGREDGKTKGEYAPIFYRKDRFTVEKSGNFWLAEDMNAVGKKGWDAACERVATWAILKDKNTGKRLFFLNTHLDHMGKVARHEGALLVIDQATKLSRL